MTIAQITSESGHLTIVLPAGFQMEGKQVSVRRRGNTLILEPISDNWQWVKRVAGRLDQDVLDAARSANSAGQLERITFPDLDSI